MKTYQSGFSCSWSRAKVMCSKPHVFANFSEFPAFNQMKMCLYGDELTLRLFVARLKSCLFVGKLKLWLVAVGLWNLFVDGKVSWVGFEAQKRNATASVRAQKSNSRAQKEQSGTERKSNRKITLAACSVGIFLGVFLVHAIPKSVIILIVHSTNQ